MGANLCYCVLSFYLLISCLVCLFVCVYLRFCLFVFEIRDMGNGLPLFLFGRSISDEVYEFQSSPFNNEHLKFSRLLNFHHGNKEDKVGDFFILIQGNASLYQIRSIRYNKNKDLHPFLTFSTARFTKASIFYTERRHLKPPTRPSANEYIETEERITFRPSDIHDTCRLLPFKSKYRLDNYSFYCRYSFTGTNYKITSQ